MVLAVGGDDPECDLGPLRVGVEFVAVRVDLGLDLALVDPGQVILDRVLGAATRIKLKGPSMRKEAGADDPTDDPKPIDNVTVTNQKGTR